MNTRMRMRDRKRGRWSRRYVSRVPWALSLAAAVALVGCSDSDVTAPDLDTPIEPAAPTLGVEMSSARAESGEVVVMTLTIRGLAGGGLAWLQASVSWDAEAFRFAGGDGDMEQIEFSQASRGWLDLRVTGREGLEGDIQLRFLALEDAGTASFAVHDVVAVLDDGRLRRDIDVEAY